MPRHASAWPAVRAAALVFGWAAAAVPATAQPDSTMAWHLDLNIAATRLHLWRDGVLVARYRVAVGQPGYPTPVGSFAIASVEWNPWWVPPSSDWARGRQPEPPGPGNPMGRVKLNFKPLYFLHGTPAVESIGSASSHGCIRMDNADAIALAARLMAAASGADSATVALLTADTVTTSSWLLERPVPLTIDYQAVEFLADTLWLHPDPYRRSTAADERIRADSLLVAACRAIDLVPTALDSVLAGDRTRSIAVPTRFLQPPLPRACRPGR